MRRRWVYPKTDIRELRQDKRMTGISDIALKILSNRGYDTPEKIESFLFSTLDDLHDTRRMQDAEKAIDLLITAIKNHWKIVVYGDYDSDGIESTVTMTSLLRDAGGDAEFYTNDRFIQGYGMMPSGVDAILKMYPDTKLIVTVDNGIMAFEGVTYAKSLGLKVIVTDHHEQGEELPEADAVIDPKRKDDEYPFKGLCGAGVAFKLMLLLYWEMGLTLQTVYDMLDIVALATVGDIVPIVDENRVIVKAGLEMIRQEKRPVFRIFREITGAQDVNAHFTLGFIYVPMLNAIGRMDGDPRRAIEMFLEDDEDVIKGTIEYLKEVNERRKELTKEQCEEAEEILQTEGIKSVICIACEHFHEGIVGLIAGRLKEKYNRPAFVFTKHNGVLKGSARSIDGFHLKEAFTELKESMLGGGGHAKAGGLSVSEDMYETFERELVALGDKWLKEEDFIKKYFVDAKLDARSITTGVVDDLKELEPFGEGFPKPVLALANFEAKRIFFMGSEKNHVKLEGSGVSVIMWSQSQKFSQMGEPLAIRALGYPSLNVYKNRVSLQFVVDNDNFIGA